MNHYENAKTIKWSAGSDDENLFHELVTSLTEGDMVRLFADPQTILLNGPATRVGDDWYVKDHLISMESPYSLIAWVKNPNDVPEMPWWEETKYGKCLLLCDAEGCVWFADTEEEWIAVGRDESAPTYIVERDFGPCIPMAWEDAPRPLTVAEATAVMTGIAQKNGGDAVSHIKRAIERVMD